nr:hypothetical protein [Tanacetum cinerariifolium]GFA47539.1 hypothetical protein [Tanacetum cinerariifolium]
QTNPAYERRHKRTGVFIPRCKKRTNQIIVGGLVSQEQDMIK